MKANLYLLGVDTLAGKHQVGVYVDDDADDGGAAATESSLRPFRVPAPVERPAALADRVLQSPIPEVTDEGWTQFAVAMKTQDPTVVSASNGLGMFDMKPRRLADLGLMKIIGSTRSPARRMAWLGEWVSPLTQDKFLATPNLQYRAFAASMKRYVGGLRDGSVPLPDGGLPPEMTLSGVLALLHRCGPNGLKTWSDAGKRFPATIALFEATNGLF
jgi:hypothetical protein